MADVNVRTIQTGTKADPKYLDMYKAVIGQMSDGIWENSGRMDGYWRYVSIDTDTDGNIVIEVDDTDGEWYRTWNHHWYFRKNKFYNMKDIDVLNFFIEKIAYICNLEMRDRGTKDLNQRAYYLDYNSGLTFNDAKAYVKHMRAIIRTVRKIQLEEVA